MLNLDEKVVKSGKYMQFAQNKPQLLTKAIYHCTWNSILINRRQETTVIMPITVVTCQLEVVPALCCGLP
jgi:hypothetical protein